MLLLLNRKLVLVVTKILPSKEKREFWIILLFLHGHLFKLRSVAGHELGQFVDDIAELLVFWRRGNIHNLQSRLWSGVTTVL